MLQVFLVALLFAATVWSVPCDLTPIPFGCSDRLNPSTFVGIGVDVPTSIPFEIVHAASAPSNESLQLIHVAAANAPNAQMVLSAWDAATSTSPSAMLRIDASARELRLVAPESGRIVMEQDGKAFTIDPESGCLLVNGQLPLQSPCRQTIATIPSPTPSSLSNITTLSSLSQPVIAAWVLIVVGLATFICGSLVGCFMGYCSAKYRMRRVAPM